ncbi:MAG TPA: iron-sulfur cluster assembly protein [Ktedonobacteraceae bacterium]|nr:iron-sulfur cluster assembly protein [Ktedonobacteraceae bacterium]
MTTTGASYTEVTEEHIYQAIADVLDPELDESLVKLGFIDRVQVDGADVSITFKLPTYWCAPNFAYLMAADLRRQASSVPGVRSVRVILLDHCAEDEVTNGVNQNQSFSDAFPGEASEDAHLEELRRIFLRKGFLMRQDALLRQMLKLGLDEATIAALRVADMRMDEATNAAFVTADGREYCLERAGRNSSIYQQRRVALGLPHASADPLIIDDAGQPLRTGELQQFLRRSRSVRMNIMFNTAMCKGLFHTRYGGSSAPDDEDM